MTKIILYICLAVLLFSCAGGAAPNAGTPLEDASFWDMSAVNGELVIIGAAGIRINQKKSIELALEDAARKAAMYNEAEGFFVRKEYLGGSFLDFRMENSNGITVDENYPALAEKLRYDPEKDVVYRKGEAVYVRTRFTPAFPLSIVYRPSSGKVKPAWISNPPREISTFKAGVGYSGPRMRHQDTIRASYEDAFYSIIKNHASFVSSEKLMFQGQGTLDYTNTTETTIASSARLKGFYVLDFWTDPADKSVWTLAVAREFSELIDN